MRYPNWEKVNETTRGSWDEPPEAKYFDDFYGWLYENGLDEEFEELDAFTSNHKNPADEREKAMERIERLASEFVNAWFVDPEPPEPSGEWDWSPRGW